ncbi:CRISPR-associated protein Cse3 [Bifidobacterium italicum]|uniref:CRISPR-associated protein Cse3 n=1 Tax=Bifidobacterium italicum TaxID=1960968 RepID=A0A2A2EF77_9BIFI|nr:type I-E CRISPR-associated protein Cas6/Cse3/CasE [Bifidobacterium italicum]PAU67575.1 CRISPR-associated protein Cse3 [Bifidobacterium italicum]
MYLSRMQLNLARFEAKQLIASPYRMHAAVEHAFPPDAVRNDEWGRVLWRIDHNEQSHSTVLYVVSPETPDFTHLVEQAGWPSRCKWETREYSKLLDRLTVGQQWNFRLRANPVRKAAHDRAEHSRRTPEQIIGKRQGYVTVSQQIDWLLRRAEANGFEVLEEESGPALRVTQRKREQFNRGGSKVTLSTAVFDGCLRITDADRFRHALCHGIGPAKGFGCGLMTIAPMIVSAAEE